MAKRSVRGRPRTSELRNSHPIPALCAAVAPPSRSARLTKNPWALLDPLHSLLFPDPCRAIHSCLSQQVPARVLRFCLGYEICEDVVDAVGGFVDTLQPSHAFFGQSGCGNRHQSFADSPVEFADQDDALLRTFEIVPFTARREQKLHRKRTP